MLRVRKRFACLGEQFFSYIKPSVLTLTNLVHINRQLQTELGLSGITDDELMAIISGQKEISEYSSLATIYAGHQFGVFVPELGDGRAILIAEHLDPNGSLWELQLKGAGKTPYSRMGDGRAVLRSSLREYLASHAMHKLGIATTQALAIINAPQTPVYREQVESAAIVLRVAPSFIRFGHFELFASRNQVTELKQLLEFVIVNYYPEIEPDHPEAILQFLSKVVKNTAEMIANWQSVGFVHGVMNSDNMSILGLTLDYGPYVYMDSFRPKHAYNHSDSEGRYTYASQAYIGWWNLYRLAEALSLIYPYPEQLENTLAVYAESFNLKYTELMGKKLGFNPESGFDLELSEKLLKIMLDYQMDWTYTWRQLSMGDTGKDELVSIYSLGNDFTNWYQDWLQLLAKNEINFSAALQIMQASNPALILRNHLLQNAIVQAEIGDYTELDNLFEAISDPYQENPSYPDYYKLPPSWAEHIELSCSS